MIQCGVVVGPGFGWRDISYWLEHAPVAEPVDPFEGGEHQHFIAAPSANDVEKDRTTVRNATTVTRPSWQTEGQIAPHTVH
ncbi:hypothetical protein VW35_08280 [Devosia soli]|uniref:Uncharacterized protein n=1 Tax=Devosia soli TaxID=361041 RepID=A0A0F5LDA4_9HYPH|nr:hypothetical protein VW35_08280 [Devosia soli]